MCGVIGYWTYDPKPEADAAFKRLFSESAVRGLHAFGLYQRYSETIRAFHHDMVFDWKLPAIAHARYSTSGDWKNHSNNQPLALSDFVLVFNGVISMGTRKEMEQAFHVELETENDGEIFLR